MQPDQPIARQHIDRRAAVTMVVLCLIWGTQQSVIKLVGDAMSPVLQMALRSSVAALGVLVIARARRETRWINRTTLVPGILVGMLFGLEFALVGEALRFTSASHVTVYLYSAPILIAVGLGFAHRDERLRPEQWLGVLVAFSGVAVTFLGRGDPGVYPVMALGDALALGGALAWAMTAIVLRGSKLANAPATVTLFYQLLGAAIEGSAMAWATSETAVHPTIGLAIALAWQILVVAFFSYLTWFALLRRYSSARLSVLSFMTPVFGVAAGVIALGDRIDAGFGLGAAMILGGIVFATTGLPHRRKAVSI